MNPLTYPYSLSSFYLDSIKMATTNVKRSHFVVTAGEVFSSNFIAACAADALKSLTEQRTIRQSAVAEVVGALHH